MFVLVACECSQQVTSAFRSLGHAAFSCDLVPQYGGHPEWHVVSDVIPLLSGFCSFSTEDGTTHSIPSKWDLIIAHPPCTYLSSVSACRLFNSDHTIKDFHRESLGWSAREFFLSCLYADCPRVCVENPAPLSYFNLPPYSQIIQPFMFGHPYKKRTCLWLRNLPLLQPTDPVIPSGCWVVSGGGSSCRIKTKSLPSVSSSRLRSKTFSGVAFAMASQWGIL